MASDTPVTQADLELYNENIQRQIQDIKDSQGDSGNQSPAPTVTNNVVTGDDLQLFAANMVNYVNSVANGGPQANPESYAFMNAEDLSLFTSKMKEWTDDHDDKGDLLPSDGVSGQVLTKTQESYTWQDPAAPLPSGGSVGQVLTRTEGGEAAWQDTGKTLPDGGTPGQVLTKTEESEEWATIVPMMYVEGTTLYINDASSFVSDDGVLVIGDHGMRE